MRPRSDPGAVLAERPSEALSFVWSERSDVTGRHRGRGAGSTRNDGNQHQPAENKHRRNNPRNEVESGLRWIGEDVPAELSLHEVDDLRLALTGVDLLLNDHLQALGAGRVGDVKGRAARDAAQVAGNLVDRERVRGRGQQQNRCTDERQQTTDQTTAAIARPSKPASFTSLIGPEMWAAMRPSRSTTNVSG